ncbi:MAG TPA: cytochrome P450 [Candidatus Dormibacteraeota bacterium]|nr:cytochrome P450 [Candidatus Dormibacteraeota bacterium]
MTRPSSPSGGGASGSPADPIAAVTHPDPYPYYRALVARAPLYRDEALGLWVAASAHAVTAALTSPLGRVRPAAEPVPATLVASPAADVFGRLARMTDGPGHATMKQAVSATLDSVDAPRALGHADRWARSLSVEIDPRSSPARVDEFALALSAHVIGSLLAMPDEALPAAERCVGQYTGGVSPGADAAHVERGKAAAGHLIAMVRSLTAPEPGETTGLLGVLHREAGRAGGADAPAVVANAIGFLTQAYEATAGLIGNTLLALAARPDLRARVERAPDLLTDAIREVLRYDPPVQNTRRFIVADGPVAGQRMTAGDTVLVVLASANHDAAENPAPERFDVSRASRRTFTLGAGIHGCPGESLAITIARAGVEQLLARGVALAPLAEAVTYRPSGNLRVPLFDRGAA